MAKKNDTKMIAIAAAAILLILAFIFGLREKPLVVFNDTAKYACQEDANCIGYGTCRIECVNKDWAAQNPDPGPYCQLLLPDFNCTCVNNNCEARIAE